MKLQVEVGLACLVSLIWIQQILCDDISDTSQLNKWACTCSSAYEGNQSFAIGANCSTSCDCSPGENGWTCICAAGGFPKVAANNHGTSCFTACNCTSGPSSEGQSSKKRISSKVVVIILLLCVVFTTLAFVASVLCYVFRRDKGPIQPPQFLSDKETSWNSATNLIGHSANSVAKSRAYNGWVHKASLFRGKTRTIHGTIIQFSYSELENATNKFSNSNLIGVGSSSHVYCGHLKDNRTVAIKRLKTQGGPDSEAVFLTEIELLSILHHCHVVPLLGYCLENRGKHDERLLVFEYMPNGNLRECLDGASGKFLDWGARVVVALGAARGLEYLHEAAAPRILHRDVKSSNILLDENWRAKITDLGMAKHLRNDGLHSGSSSPARMQGTFGYFAPEYAIVGRASLKSDVFSFGVVLLELITGRHPIHKSPNKGEESLVIWATPRLQDSRRVILELPDPHLKGNFLEEEIQIMAYLAKECLLLDPDSRPTMSEVVQILSTIAPEKSRRRNISIDLLQSTSPGTRGETDIEKPGKQVELPIEEEEIKQVISNGLSARCSPPLDTDRTLCVAKKVKDSDTVSTVDVERLIMLTSNARSWHSQDDEAVDLTAPRFESFSNTEIV